MSVPQVPSRTVMVTGCSSGIGAATALFLREAGWQVHPTARKPDDLEALRSAGFSPIAMDVADPAAVEAAVRDLLARDSEAFDVRRPERED